MHQIIVNQWGRGSYRLPGCSVLGYRLPEMNCNGGFRGKGRRLATKGTKSTKGRTPDRDLPFVLFVPFVANLLPLLQQPHFFP
jgi:hypothetical protein